MAPHCVLAFSLHAQAAQVLLSHFAQLASANV